MRPLNVVRMTLACWLLGATMASAQSTTEWDYRTTSEIRPAARSILLTEEAPPDFRVDLGFSGSTQRYAQLRYGSKNSRRVVIVVDHDSTKKTTEIYADLDRDRVLTTEEKLPGDGRRRRVTLATEIIQEDQIEQLDRLVELKLGLTGKQLSVATVGFMEGHTSGLNGGEPLRVRRIDGDANGLFADARDRVLIDLNGDQTWDRVAEQFVLLPIMKLGGRRFAVRADRLGESFGLTELAGTGTLSLTISGLPEAAKLIEFEAMMYSNDRSAYILKRLDSTLEVPVGKYVIGSVSMTIDMGSRDLWHYVFSRSGVPSDYEWHTVGTNQSVELEVIGQTRFKLNVGSRDASPGDQITFSPSWVTQDGLLINLCSRGRFMGNFELTRNHQVCRTTLQQDATILGSAQSGFA